jgi:Flp pilus assembly protein TadD
MSELYPLAMRHHQAGNLGEAERLYRLILQEEPRHGDALHLLGVLHHQSGRNEAAVELIRQAIAQNGSNPTAKISERALKSRIQVSLVVQNP